MKDAIPAGPRDRRTIGAGDAGLLFGLLRHETRTSRRTEPSAAQAIERNEKEMANKYLYLFSEGNANMRELLGGKGANLAEMTNIGLPVPQGFTITTEACTQYYEDGEKINDEIQAQIMEYITKLEEITGKKFGDMENPLLVSVRSGARASMPGMMDTILNLGLNEDVVPEPGPERGRGAGAGQEVRQPPLGL